MKPVYVVLLVIGAALAGGLAVRMSQPTVVETSSYRAAVPVSHPAAPSVEVARTEVPAARLRAVAAAPDVTTAPAPVYVEQATVASPAGLPAPKKVSFSAAAKQLAAPVSPAPYRPAASAEAPPATQAAAPVTESIPAALPSPAPALVAEAAKPEPAPEAAPEPRHVTLHQGMQISIRLIESLSTEHVADGDTFQASLAAPLVADGLIIAEQGARVRGKVVNTQRGGRAGGASQLELALSSIRTADGQTVSLPTEPWVTGGGKALDIPNETVLRFRLAASIVITERPI